jgi:hypothetical protein
MDTRKLSETEYNALSLSEKTAYMIARLERLSNQMFGDGRRRERTRIVLDAFGIEPAEWGVN